MYHPSSKSLIQRVTGWWHGLFGASGSDQQQTGTSSRTTTSNGSGNVAAAPGHENTTGTTTPIRGDDPAAAVAGSDRDDTGVPDAGASPGTGRYDTEPDTVNAMYGPDETVGAEADAQAEEAVNTSREADFGGDTPEWVEQQEAETLDEGADPANYSAEEELEIVRGASADEYDAGGYQPGTTDVEEVEAAVDTDIGAPGAADDYADIPDMPVHQDADDTGRDDFLGSDYPSQHLTGQSDTDIFDATTPDYDQTTGPPGDQPQDLTEAQELGAVDDEAGDELTGTGYSPPPIDQDEIASTDDLPGVEDPDRDLPGDADFDQHAPEPAFTPNEARGLLDAAGTGSLQNPTDPGGGAFPEAVAPTPDQTGRQGPEGDREIAARPRDVPAGAVPGDGGTACPTGYPIKGNASSRIYHTPQVPSYEGTKPEWCFATEEDAIAAGYRAPGKRHRGRGNKAGSHR